MNFHELNYLGTRWKIGAKVKFISYKESDIGIIVGYFKNKFFSIQVQYPNGSVLYAIDELEIIK